MQTRLSPKREMKFGNLRETEYSVTSAETPDGDYIILQAGLQNYDIRATSFAIRISIHSQPKLSRPHRHPDRVRA